MYGERTKMNESTNFELPSLTVYSEIISSLGKEAWNSLALQYNKVSNNYYSKDEEEWVWIQSAKELLNETLPEEYKTGVHLIGEKRGFMGEDIYVFEGHITSTVHCKHKECGQYKVLNWDRLYCAHCQKDLKSEDVI